MKRLLFVALLFLVACMPVTPEIPDASFQERLDQVTVPETYDVYHFGESHHSGGDRYSKFAYTIRNEVMTGCRGESGFCCTEQGFQIKNAEDRCQAASWTMNNIVDALRPENADATVATSKMFSDRVCYYPVTLLEREIGHFEALVCFDENNRVVTFLSPVYAGPSASSWHLKEFPPSEEIYEFVMSVDKSKGRFDKANPRPSGALDKLAID